MRFCWICQCHTTQTLMSVYLLLQDQKWRSSFSEFDITVRSILYVVLIQSCSFSNQNPLSFCWYNFALIRYFFISLYPLVISMNETNKRNGKPIYGIEKLRNFSSNVTVWYLGSSIFWQICFSPLYKLKGVCMLFTNNFQCQNRGQSYFVPIKMMKESQEDNKSVWLYTIYFTQNKHLRLEK
jgi:hypothetical protein